MDVVALTLTDRVLLAERYDLHSNSHRIMREALLQRGAEDAALRLEALRSVERAFDLDLGLVCHLYEHRFDLGRHPIETTVVDFITDAGRYRPDIHAAEELLWILPDRVRQVRDLMQGHVVGDRD